MPFLNPWGLLGVLSLVAILLLYFLRQRHQEQVIPSTYLWIRAIQQLEATRPWQKLRKNMLMLLQLLAALLLTLAIARPFSLAATAGDWIVVLDTSASMQATDVSPTRFDYAITQLNNLVNGLRPGHAVTVIQAGNQAQVKIGRSTDKAMLLDQISKLRVQNTAAELADALSLARALSRESDAQVLLLSDQQIHAQDVKWMDCGGQGENVSIRPLTYQHAQTGLTVLSTVYHEGETKNITLECEVDGVLFDVQEVTLPSDSVVPVYWDGLPEGATTVRVSTSHEDALMLDNQAQAAIAQQQAVSTLLVSAGNRFLEAALSLHDGLVLEKTTPQEERIYQGYDLYVLDGVMPDTLPQDGAVMLINPPRIPSGLAGKMAEVQGGTLATAIGREDEALMLGAAPDQIHVASANSFVDVTNFDPLMTLTGQPVVLTGSIDRSPAILIGFDVRNSDWPLKKEFPVFIHNALQWMLPYAAQGIPDAAAGQPVMLGALAQATQMTVISPDGTKSILAPPFPPTIFEDTYTLGLYTVQQKLPHDQLLQSRFAVHLPVQESVLKSQEMDAQQAQPVPVQGRSLRAMVEYAPYLLLVALLILMLEWGVSTRVR